MKDHTCDTCGESWEKDFICEKHSGWVETSGNSFDSVPEEEYMKVCLNCCNCAVIGMNTKKYVPGDHDESLPF